MRIPCSPLRGDPDVGRLGQRGTQSEIASATREHNASAGVFQAQPSSPPRWRRSGRPRAGARLSPAGVWRVAPALRWRALAVPRRRPSLGVAAPVGRRCGRFQRGRRGPPLESRGRFRAAHRHVVDAAGGCPTQTHTTTHIGCCRTRMCRPCISQKGRLPFARTFGVLDPCDQRRLTQWRRLASVQ